MISSAWRDAVQTLSYQAPGQIIDKIAVNTGARAYRRPDGVAVVPLALLGG